MRASISEVNGRLQLRIDAETYEERLLFKAFIREQMQMPDARLTQCIQMAGDGSWAIEVGACP